VVADETARRAVAGAAKVRLRWLAIVVAIMALLTAGWPLLNSAIANRQPLPSGARITIGAGPASSGVLRVGHGWYVQPAQTNPTQQYVLRNGAVELDIRHVALVDRHQVAFVWRGMRQILSVIDPGFGLGEPVSYTTVHGWPGITGAVSGPALLGTVTIVPGPSREFAIGMIVLAPRGTSRTVLAAAHRIVISLMFPSAGR